MISSILGATAFLMVADAKDVTLHSPVTSPTPTSASTPTSALLQPLSRGDNVSSSTKNRDRCLLHPSEPSIRIAVLMQQYYSVETHLGSPSCSRPGRAAGPAPSPTPVPSRVIVYSVREVLLSAGKQHGWRNGSIIPCVLGVVIYKGLLVDEVDPQPPSSAFPDPNEPESYRTFCNRQAADYRQSHQPHNPVRVKKCRVVLRDDEYDDIITLYIPVTMAAACAVGLCVAVWGSTIHLASSMRTLYLKTADHTEIGAL